MVSKPRTLKVARLSQGRVTVLRRLFLAFEVNHLRDICARACAQVIAKSDGDADRIGQGITLLVLDCDRSPPNEGPGRRGDGKHRPTELDVMAINRHTTSFIRSGSVPNVHAKLINVRPKKPLRRVGILVDTNQSPRNGIHRYGLRVREHAYSPILVQ